MEGAHVAKGQRDRTERGADPLDELQTLNFKVTDTFKRDFKVYAARRGITMLQLLREGFELSRQRDPEA